MRLLAIALLLFGCGREVEKKEPNPDDRVGELMAKYPSWLEEAERLRNPATGWLLEDGDGMRYTGLYAAAPGVTGVQVGLAEYEDQPGRFGRNPKKTGSAISWSRDAGLGFLIWAEANGNRAAIERHRDYGLAHVALADGVPIWQMGLPVADGRVNYYPSMIGNVFQVIYHLGGADDANRYWPNLYTSGLTDFEAALQVLDIWLRGAIDGVKPIINIIGEPQLLDSISETMYARLREHHDREPDNPLFQYVWGQYSGDMGPALNACLHEGQGSYIRCSEPRRCQLAELIFACGGVLRSFGAVP